VIKFPLKVFFTMTLRFYN